MTAIDKQVVARIVYGCIGREPDEVTSDSIEQISTSFHCLVGDRTLVVELREPSMSYGLMKERLFSDKLRAVGIPGREAIGHGTYEGLSYTVVHKERGTKLAYLAPEELGAALACVFDTLRALSSVDMSGTEGYGWFNELGSGPDRTWLAHLAKIQDEEPGMFFGNWHSMFSTTFLERTRFELYFSRMMKLLDNREVPRSLVHGSFSTYNVLVENGRVSAVLDWQDARFGDPLFDLASLDFWPTSYNLVDLYERYCAHLGTRHNHYRQRVTGYKYYQALGGMMYFAKIGNQDAYNKVVTIADNLETGTTG